MIPNYSHHTSLLWPILPPGIWDASLSEIEERFVFNERRELLFAGMKPALDNLFLAGSPQIFLDGSYVTEKPLPNDFEICWDTNFVNPDILDPVFLIFDSGRKAQKDKFYGEFFPAMMVEGLTGKPFLDFFQVDKNTGRKKGIIRLKNYLTIGGQDDNK
jgi:hypothetical protein